MAKVAEKVPSWVERLLFPRFASIDGELKVLHSEISRVDEKVDSLRNEMSTRIDSFDKSTTSRFDSLEKSTIFRFDNLEKSTNEKFEAMEKLMTAKFDAVEARLDSIESRFGGVEEMAEIRFRLTAIEKKVGS